MAPPCACGRCHWPAPNNHTPERRGARALTVDQRRTPLCLQPGSFNARTIPEASCGSRTSFVCDLGPVIRPEAAVAERPSERRPAGLSGLCVLESDRLLRDVGGPAESGRRSVCMSLAFRFVSFLFRSPHILQRSNTRSGRHTEK
jgi:hypothetical protein